MILSGFGLQFWSIWLSGGCLGLPWDTLGPLGGQGAPNMGPGSEKLVRWTPPWPPKMRSFLHKCSMFFLLKNALFFDYILMDLNVKTNAHREKIDKEEFS